MSGGNRNSGTTPLEALVIILILFVVVFVIYAAGQHFGIQAGRDEVTAREHYDRAYEDELAACAGLDGAALSKCNGEAIETAQDKSESRQDLYAQKDMAKWAFWMLVISALTFCVTAIGVWFVKRTLDATLAALSEAEAATTAAQEMARDAREIGETQLRPWVLSNGADLFTTFNTTLPTGVVPKAQIFQVKWKNFGQSPAVNVEAYISFVLVKPHAPFEDFESPELTGDVVIAQGIGINSSQTYVPADQYADFMASKLDLIIFSKCGYSFSANPDRRAFTEVTFRCRVDGIQIDKQTGDQQPRYFTQLAGSQNRAT